MLRAVGKIFPGEGHLLQEIASMSLLDGFQAANDPPTTNGQGNPMIDTNHSQGHESEGHSHHSSHPSSPCQPTSRALTHAEKSPTKSPTKSTKKSPIDCSSIPINEDDRNTLISMYESGNGPSWTRKSNWMTSQHVALWQGVTVDRSTGKVVRLDLSSNNIPVISMAISRLSSLIGLDLRHNKLTDSSIASLMPLKRLQSLRLDYNEVTTIPTEIGYMTELREFSISHNKLAGTIPATVDCLENLVELDLSHNMLYGTITSNIGALIKLERLILNDNHLTGSIPSSVGYLAGLREVNLKANRLTEAIPGDWTNLKHIRRINLSHNKLTESIPESLFRLPHLIELDLSHNHLAGQVLPFAVPAADATDAEDPSRSNQGKEVMEANPSNESAGTEKNAALSFATSRQISTIAKRGISMISSTTNTLLGSNSSSQDKSAERSSEERSKSPETVFQMEIFDISHNKLSGFLSARTFRHLKRLNVLNISNNQLTNMHVHQTSHSVSHLDELFEGLDALTSIDLSFNQFVGPLPRRLFYHAVGLKSIHMQGNQLYGNIPSSLGRLNQLEHLDLSQNQFKGSLPPSMGHLANLVTCNLSNNHISGKIRIERMDSPMGSCEERGDYGRNSL